MVMENTFKPGQKVNYKGYDNGIVKTCSNGFVYVVFNCSNNWDRYEDYTAAPCNPNDLNQGWI